MSISGDPAPAPLLRALENWKLHWQHALDHNQPADVRAEHEKMREQYQAEILQRLHNYLNRNDI